MKYNIDMNYYDELIQQIEDLLDSRQYEEAKRIILNELNLPYVPQDIESKLNVYLNIISDNTKVYKAITDDELISYLKGDDNHQLIAVDELSRKNLRDYIDVCDEYLKSNNNENAKALLIDSLIRQEINYEFTLVNNCSILKFNPKDMDIVEESKEFIDASVILNDYYMKDPSKLKIGLQLLYKEAMLTLPNRIDSRKVVDKITKYIDDAFSNK